jgi:Leucine-rich repeat (LRR) protein
MLGLLYEMIFSFSFLIANVLGCEASQTTKISYTLFLKNLSYLEKEGDVVTTTEEVTVVIIENCSLKQLGKNTFNLANTNSKLFVGKCNIEEIEVDILNGLNVFTSFAINYNPIRNIKRHTFRNHGVENIDLSINKITTIESEAFVNLSKLEKINLNQNLIQCLEFEAFSNLPGLVFFLVERNRIKKIGRGCFQFVQKDEATISLGQNKITELNVATFENFTSNNATINFINNSIENLPEGLFDNHVFEVIDLSLNKIHNVPKEVCRNNCKIEEFFFYSKFLDEDQLNKTFEWATKSISFIKESMSVGDSNSNNSGLHIVIFIGSFLLADNNLLHFLYF